MGLAGALAARGDKQAAIDAARTAIPALKVMQARELTRHFVDSLGEAIPGVMADGEFEAFVAEAEGALPTDD